MTENLEMCVFTITQWVYFTHNYPEPQKMFVEIYGNNLGSHIYSKWLSYDGNFNVLFCNLDSECQAKLARYVVENYHGVDARRPK